ncbi:hypothetical protein [Nostoc sp. LPT]|uniref:hypothetical protein n=1 Tax=Nostoc sp. LPT TaxID=2815387 RepID=UPI001D9BDCAA|nr:hypothetical protein [Nostoc sp. LPT]MBN4004825.1 hypothetical protein [Nostoc sp. LPT]
MRRRFLAACRQASHLWEANTSMQWTSDVYDGLRLRTRLDARIISRNLVEMIGDEN